MRITRKMIQYKIDAINSICGTEYKTNYNPDYGGYNLYYLRGTGHANGYIGFDIRKNAREMYDYLTGVLSGLAIAKTIKY